MSPPIYYSDDSCTIYHGDALEILPLLSPPPVTVGAHDAGSSRLESVPDTGSLGGTPASLRVDLALIDPPYNAGIEYGSGTDDNRGPDEYEVWCSDWFASCRHLSARTVVFPGHGNLGQWMPRRPSGVGCWYKPGNPAGGGVFQHCEWEPFLLWGRARGIPDVIRATITEQSGVGDHPCPKPLGLYRALLVRGHAESVLDPFMGSGTALRAAKDVGIKAIGIEIEEKYCEIAARRLGQEVLAL